MAKYLSETGTRTLIQELWNKRLHPEGIYSSTQEETVILGKITSPTGAFHNVNASNGFINYLTCSSINASVGNIEEINTFNINVSNDVSTFSINASEGYFNEVSSSIGIFTSSIVVNGSTIYRVESSFNNTTSTNPIQTAPVYAALQTKVTKPANIAANDIPLFNNSGDMVDSNIPITDITIAKGSGANSIITRGLNNTATNKGSISLGSDNTARGNYSVTLGQGLTTSNIAETAIGRYNISRTNNSLFPNENNTHFTIGIGTSNLISSTKNALEVRQNGDLYVLGVGEYNGTAISLGASTVQTVINSKIGTDDKIPDSFINALD